MGSLPGGRTRLALFDFDHTLVDFDTVNPFIRYVLRRHRELDVPPDTSLPHKQYRLLLLKGLGRSEIDRLASEYYRTQIRPNLIDETMSCLKRLKEQGYFVCLISGSYDVYLRYFVSEFAIDRLICTKVSFTDDVCDGVFEGVDCLGENKLILLAEHLGTSDFTSLESIAFSDAASDLPLLRSCRISVVVRSSRDKVASWAEDAALEKMVYKIGLAKIMKRKIQWHLRRILRESN